MYLHFSGSSTYFQRAFDRIKSISRYRGKWCDAAHKNGQSRRAYREQYWMRMRNILPNILMGSCPHWQSLSNYYLAFCQIKAFQLVRNSTVMIAHYWVSSQSVAVGRSALSEQWKNKQATKQTLALFPCYGKNYQGLQLTSFPSITILQQIACTILLVSFCDRVREKWEGDRTTAT